MEHVYIADTSGGAGSQKAGIYFQGNCNECRINALMEVLSSIQFDGVLSNSQLNITWGGVDATTTGALLVNRLKSNFLINDQITVDLEANFTRKILTTVDSDESTASSYAILHSSIWAFDANGSTPTFAMPANVAANAASIDYHLYPTDPTGADSFSGGPTLDATNATGDGTIYNLNSVGFTVDRDPGVQLNTGSGVFTAKSNGVYNLSCQISLANLGAGHTDVLVDIIANGQAYLVSPRLSPGVVKTSLSEFVTGGSHDIYLAGGQTAYCQVTVSGSTKSVTVSSGTSGTNWRTRFEGHLVH
jgi:hypothetical protein